MVAAAAGERLTNRTPMPVAPSTCVERAVLADPADLGLDRERLGRSGSENFSVIRSPILPDVVVAMNRPPELMFCVRPV